MIRFVLTLALFLVVSFSCFSQIEFEKGYFISDDNQKIECLIRNLDWDYNPTEFSYMLSSNADIQEASIEQVKEFGINGVSKYVRASVKMDRASNDESNLSAERNPVFSEERLFLKVLVEGKASLLLFKREQLIRFFLAGGDTITQLIYKRYLVNGYKLAINNTFKQQLLVNLKCQGVPIDNLERIKYQTKHLEQVLIKYNECNGYKYAHFHKTKEHGELFNFAIKLGPNISSISADRLGLASDWKTDFSGKIGLKLGLEAEFILPFNKDKWSIYVEPAYQSFNSENQTNANNISGGILVSKVDYKSLELPIGVRHYFFLSNESKIFLNAAFVVDFDLNSTMQYARLDGSVLYEPDLATSRTNIAIGVGFKYKTRYSLEARYYTSRHLGIYNVPVEYKSAAVIIGYSLF